MKKNRTVNYIFAHAHPQTLTNELIKSKRNIIYHTVGDRNICKHIHFFSSLARNVTSIKRSRNKKQSVWCHVKLVGYRWLCLNNYHLFVIFFRRFLSLFSPASILGTSSVLTEARKNYLISFHSNVN